MNIDKKVIDAVVRGRRDKLEDALRSGGDANSTELGMSALRLAALSELPDLMGVLIAHGAVVDMPDETGATLLLDCAFIGNSSVVSVLLAAGANANVADINGQTPLMAADKAGNAAVVKLLKKYGAC